MTTLLCVLLAVLVLIVAAIVVIRVSSKPKPPQDSQAGETQKGKTDWSKEWEKWKEKIAIPLSVIAFGAIWWLNEPNSFSKATHSKMFWSGAFLVGVIWGYFLTLPKTFKESFFRKSFMLTAFPVGLAMILLSFIPVEKVKAEVFPATASVSTQQHRIVLQTGPNSWTLVDQLPSHTDFTIDYPGNWLEYKLHDGRRIRHENTTGKKYLTDIKGNILGPPPTIFPGRTFYIRTEKTNQTTITW